MTDELTGKQFAFVQEYLIDFNATKAARRAGYQGSYNSLSAIGSKNLRKPKINNAIQERMADLMMQGGEALARLTKQARATIDDFISKGKDGGYKFDLEKARRAEMLDLVKKFKITEVVRLDGTIKRTFDFELYNAQIALKEIIRVHLKLREQKIDKPPLPAYTLEDYHKAYEGLSKWEAERFGKTSEEIKTELAYIKKELATGTDWRKILRSLSGVYAVEGPSPNLIDYPTRFLITSS